MSKEKIQGVGERRARGGRGLQGFLAGQAGLAGLAHAAHGEGHTAGQQQGRPAVDWRPLAFGSMRAERGQREEKDDGGGR